MLNNYLDINAEVKTALSLGKPVVALESTIISHGMPYPMNVECAKKCEEIIRSCGAVPATVAIIGGIIKVGLTEDELEYLGKTKGVIKTSRRDLPVILAKKADGATTVASTMIGAALAGIKVFATGGIGGVHRNAEQTFDISADLMELAHTNVAVVCAGAKSILDIGLTLEYLETQGVPVLGYQTEDFPNFYTRSSGFKADYKLASAKEAADILKTKWDLGLNGGAVIANPVPAEYALNSDMINQKIQQALEEAKEKGIKGKDATPFLLSKLYEITGGESLATNIQLVYNNCQVAGEIAVELSKL